MPSPKFDIFRNHRNVSKTADKTELLENAEDQIVNQLTLLEKYDVCILKNMEELSSAISV